MERRRKRYRENSSRDKHAREGRSDRSVDTGNGSHLTAGAKNLLSVTDDRQNVLKRETDGKKYFQELPIEECRKIYRNEINTLWQEVEDFRITCQKEMARQQALLDEHRRNCEEAMKKDISRAPDVTDDKDYTDELKVLKDNMNTLEEKQKLLDKEENLMEQEEQLSKRQVKLKEYEKDVEEAEALLDKRQNVAHRRSQEIELLNHDLLLMKQDLSESIEIAETQIEQSETSKTEITSEPSDDAFSNGLSTIAVNSPLTSCKARRNWQLARRHLFDKVTLLETTVQRYRTQVASSSATITAKDMVIHRLQKEANDLQDELDQKEKRIKKLESQLALSIEDKTRSDKKLDMLLEELQNIDLSGISKESSSPVKSPSKGDTTTKRRLLKKQQSMFSFLAHHGHNKRGGPSSPSVQRSRTWGDKESAKKEQVTPTKRNHNNATNDTDNLENGSNNVNFHDLEDGHAMGDLSDINDDPGSKACVVM